MQGNVKKHENKRRAASKTAMSPCPSYLHQSQSACTSAENNNNQNNFSKEVKRAQRIKVEWY
jgi:hypothetical protein